MNDRLENVAFSAVGSNCSAAVTRGPHERCHALAALAAVQAEVAACERALSRFDLQSDLSRLNAAGGRWTQVDERLLEALRLAVRALDDTRGLFDPTVLPALVAAGYDRSFEQLVERPPLPLDGWRAGAEIEVDDDHSRARIAPGTAVDLGGIGKGYAAARALEAVRAAWPHARGALVDLGGDLALRGEPPEGGPWRIAVADARRPGATAGTLLLHEGGVATSGRDVRRFGPEKALHHLIDPSTGAPAASGPLAVTVIAPDAAGAEAHATALAMLAPAEAAAHVAARPHLSAVYLPHEGPMLTLGGPPLAQRRLVLRAA
jgi:thiamine biosynthesis lipoprotein